MALKQRPKTGESRRRSGRPLTGDARKTRQPFAIDKLPSAWRDRIIALRAKWLTWEQIEEERAASLAVARKFSDQGYDKLDDAVKNALADVVFTLAKDQSDPEK